VKGQGIWDVEVSTNWVFLVFGNMA